MPRKHPFFEYVIGSFVRLAKMQCVVWRGKQLVPSITSQPYEVLVYGLDNDYWDCYYEDKL